MKTKIALSLLYIVLVPVLGVQKSNAQNASAGIEPVLSGNALQAGDASIKADVVFVGEITQLGFADMKAPGRDTYHGVKVKVLQALRGSMDTETTVTLYATYTAHERAPKVGSSYIFFAKKNPSEAFDAFTVIKLLPATDDRISKIKALIAAAPSPK